MVVKLGWQVWHIRRMRLGCFLVSVGLGIGLGGCGDKDKSREHAPAHVDDAAPDTGGIDAAPVVAGPPDAALPVDIEIPELQ